MEYREDGVVFIIFSGWSGSLRSQMSGESHHPFERILDASGGAGVNSSDRCGKVCVGVEPPG